MSSVTIPIPSSRLPRPSASELPARCLAMLCRACCLLSNPSTRSATSVLRCDREDMERQAPLPAGARTRLGTIVQQQLDKQLTVAVLCTALRPMMNVVHQLVSQDQPGFAP